MSRSVFAGLLGKSESWLYQIEHGVESRDQRLAWALLREIANQLDVSTEEVVGDIDAQSTGAVSRSGRVILAVTPIRCTSSRRLDEFLASGLCDDIVARLTKLSPLLVIGPDSTRPLIEAGRTVAGTGRELNAQVVLHGSLRELPGERLQLNLYLVDVATSVTAWSEIYDLTYTDLGAIQEQVAASIARGLQLPLSPGDSDMLSARSTDVVKAYEFYLRAVGLVSTNHEKDVNIGLGMLDKAIELDHDFAAAHAYKGYALWRRYFSGWDADIGTLHHALRSADRGLHLDPSCVMGRLARIRIYWDLGNHEQSLAEGLAVYRQNPGSLDAMVALARAYTNAGMAELALPLTERVLAADSTNPAARKLLIWSFLMARKYAQATSWGDTYLQSHHEDANTAWAVAMAHLLLGELDLAMVTVQRGLSGDRFDFTLWLLLGYVHRKRGDVETMKRIWQQGTDLVTSRLGSSGANYRVSAWLANLQAGIGERNTAQRTIEKVWEAEPQNAYLLYRLAHAYAELEERRAAVEMLDAAVQAGFLSVQILRVEEACALGRLAGDPRYDAIVDTLQRRVDALRQRYSVLG